MALANINVAVTESNISVDLQNTTVDVSSTTSNVVVGTATSARFVEDVFDAGTVSGNVTLDLNNGTIQNVLVEGNITGISISNFTTGSSLTLVITQDGLGGSILDTTTHSSNWTSWEFVNNYTDLDTTAGNYSIINVFNDGTDYYASLLTEEAPKVVNSELANANIILNNTTTSTNKTLTLGTNTTISADVITEGSTNLFYTDAKSRAAVSVVQNSPSATGSLTYSNANGVFTFTPGQGNYGDSNVATLLSDGISSNITTTANVSGNYILGNGSLLSGLPVSYSDANVISLFSNYTDAINFSTANIVSTSRMFFGREGNPGSWTYTPGNMGGISIGPHLANATSTPGFEFLTTRLDASGNPQSSTDQYGSGKIQLNSEYIGTTNQLYLNVGQNQSGSGSNHSGMQATFYSQNTLSGGSPGTYTNGGFKNNFIFNGDTRITGPINMGAAVGAGQDENFTECVIEGFNLYPYSLKVENNATVKGSIIAGSDVANTHTITGNLNITGNITATGNINYQNVEDLYVRDQQIVLNANAATDSDVLVIANRPVAGTNAAIKWNESTDKWQVNNGTGSYSDFVLLNDLSANVTTANVGVSFGSLSYDNSTGVFTLRASQPDAIFKECYAGDVYNPGVTRGQLVAMSTPPTLAPDGSDQNLDRPVVHPADAGNVQHRAFGIANVTGSSYTNTINVITSGMIKDIDTSAFRSGDTLFMSTTEGVMSNTAPTFASNVVIQEVGKVVYAHASSGIIKVNIQGSNAEDLTTLGNIHVNGNIELTDNFFVGDLDGAVTVDVNNNTGSTLTKGQAVYLDGGNTGDTPNVALANASSSTTMPAIGIVRENIADQAIGQVVTSGIMNYASHGFTQGEDLYVSETPGALVLVSPDTESGLIQKIGKVVSANHIIVQGAFRTNETPNLNDGNFFIGSGANRATTASFSTEANSAIAANLAALTSDIVSSNLISTTGNVQFNADTDVSGLSGLTFDSSTNNLGLGTPTPGAALHIRGTSNEAQIFMTEYNGTSSAGIDLRTFRAGGSEGSPTVTPKADRIWEALHYTYDGVGSSGDGVSTGFQNAFAEQIITDPSVDHAANVVPVFKQFHTYLDGDATASNPYALMRMRSNGDIQFNIANAFAYTDAANTVIAGDGTITTAGNIISEANINLTNSINVDIPDSVTSVLKVEAETPSSGTTILDVTSARSADGGPQNEYKKATGTIASPGAIGTRDYVHRNLYYGHDGTDYINTFGTMVYQDSDVGGVSTGNVPLAYEIFTNIGGDSNDGFINSIVRFDADRNIIFNDTGTRTFGNGQGNANITMDGTINTVANINATGNISGSYILGNGSQLSGVSTDNFNQIIVSGQSNVDASGPTSLTLAESGDISITTDAANNIVTISGSGGGYGNANVTNFIASGTSVGNVAFTGNLIVESGNTSYSPSSYEGNVTSGDIDRVVFSSDPGFYEGQPILFSGTINSNLVFLNGNVYYVKTAGISNTYDLYTDSGLTTGLVSGLGTEAPNSLAGSVRNESNQTNEFYGNVDISRGATLNVTNIKPYVPGGTFRMSSIRADDVGLGSNGADFFFPEIGGNTEGGILHAHSDRVGTWEDGIRRVSDSSVDIIESKIYRDGTNGTAMDFYKAGGSQASPTAPGSNDYVVQMDCFIHDGTQFLNAAGYHVYQDGDSGSVGTNDTPVSHEFYVKKDQTGYQKSVMKLTADQKIIFNDTGVRNYGNYKGTANISADGSFHTAGDVTIDGRLKLPNYTTTEINALSSPAAGDTVFNTTESTICFYNGSAWHKVTSTAL